jgi:type VI secretion system protein ImpL
MKGHYLRKLRATVDGPVKDQVTADVRAVGDLMRTDAQNFESAYNDLKLYVMLLTAPDYLDVDWGSVRLSEEWEQSLHAATNVDSDRLKAHSKSYIDALALDKTWRWQPDEQALGRARGALLRQPLEQLQYGWLIGSAKGVPPIKAQKVVTGPAAQYVIARPGVEVPGPYTKLGWEKVREALKTSGTRIVVEPWVLGGTPQDLGDVRKTSADLLRKMYFERYVRAWYDFFAGFDVQTPTDIRSAIDELAALTEPRGPHDLLFRALVDNARLELEAPSLLGKLMQKGAEAIASASAQLTGRDAGPDERAISPVEREFEPLLRFAEGDSGGGRPDGSAALRQYISELRKLDVSLTQLRESRTEPTAQFEAELARTATAVEALLGAAGFDAAMRRVLEPLFMNPIRGSRAGVVSTAFSYLNDKWKAEVWETWNGKLAGRYPFADSTDGDVTVPEFVEFFRPAMGTLWKFFDKNLQDKLERTGNQFAPRPSAESVPFLGEFLGCLNRAQEITDAIFGGGGEPVVPFSLKIESVHSDISDITLTVDGKAISYQNGPEKWLSAEWPGKGPNKGGILEVRGTSGFVDRIPRAGDFGFFRLLAWGGLKSLSAAGHDSGPVMVASWPLSRAGEPPVRIQLKPAKSVHPFAPGFFRMKCPAAITQATTGAAAVPGR